MPITPLRIASATRRRSYVLTIMNGTRLGAIVAVSLQFVLLVSAANAETDLSFSGTPVVVDGNRH